MSPLISVAEGLVLLLISVEVAGFFHAYLDVYSLRKRAGARGREIKRIPQRDLLHKGKETFKKVKIKWPSWVIILNFLSGPHWDMKMPCCRCWESSDRSSVALLGPFYAVKMLMYILAFFLNSADI